MLIRSAIFSPNKVEKEESRNKILDLAKNAHIVPSSLHNLYQAFAQGKISGFTIPAINVRTLTYDMSIIIFKTVLANQIGAVIFEISRSEMGYTHQSFDDFALCVLAGAIKENYKGPVFLQADHVQINKTKFKSNENQEIQDAQAFIQEAVSAGFYNIDIDASTLVDLSLSTIPEQQKDNARITTLLTDYIRDAQPVNTIINIGGEIGHIGDKNSTPEDLEAFMSLYNPSSQRGISKISIQTGSSHGGIPLPDGSLADTQIDFSLIKTVSNLARAKYGLGGIVQHGASTLPLQLFDQFPKSDTLEIHLATGFQNVVFDTIPVALKQEMYAWVKENLQSERENNWSEEQFLYKMRKKSLGQFKKQLWDLSALDKQPVLDALSNKLQNIFEKLNVPNTKEVITPYLY